MVAEIPQGSHSTCSIQVLSFVVCAFGWVGDGMTRVRAAPQTNFLKKFKKPIDKS